MTHDMHIVVLVQNFVFHIFWQLQMGQDGRVQIPIGQ